MNYHTAIIKKLKLKKTYNKSFPENSNIFEHGRRSCQQRHCGKAAQWGRECERDSKIRCPEVREGHTRGGNTEGVDRSLLFRSR